MAAIPEREPIGDLFTGVVLEVNRKHLLATEPLEGVEVIYSGTMIIRYGIRLLGKPQISLVPGLLALDYGDMLTGDEMWAFILNKSNLYPRADVVGYRNDGTDDMQPIKRLDLALPVEPLVYVDSNATKPIAYPIALIAFSEAKIAPRILEYLPRFDTLSAWQENQAL
jgi:hypothetical protein